MQKMWAEFPPEKYIQLTDLADDHPGGLVGAYSEMHPDNTTDWAIFEISGALTDPETNPMDAKERPCGPSVLPDSDA